jgi:hypothetical protein
VGRGLHGDGQAVPIGEADGDAHVVLVDRAEHKGRFEGDAQVVRGALGLVPVVPGTSTASLSTVMSTGCRSPREGEGTAVLISISQSPSRQVDHPYARAL